ncbi:MAG: hypothetical protein J7513_09345 [Solirubrobacteraceae bacterium]|nr:hypothetical protein [Solirubrobacteraceae bacterium]
MTDPPNRPTGAPHAIVFDSNLDALARRVAALRAAVPDCEITATSSRNAVLMLGRAAAPGTTVLADLCVTDRFSLDRPGERLIERLARHPATSHVRPLAWSAHVGPDVVEGVRRAGGVGFVGATLRREREADELRRVIAGETVWPLAPGPEDWEAWFADAYGAPWSAWMEPILVRLAGGGERRSVATELVAVGAARSANHAGARMREVARLVAGEHSNSPTVVADRASVVLARLAARRPLPERPPIQASLEQGAESLRASPSLAVAAGLTAPEVDDLVVLDRLIREQRASQPPAAGAPPADRVRAERQWAAGRLALQHGAHRDDVDEVIAGILTRTDAALVALDDARDDAHTHPAAHAAAALVALIEAEGERRADGDTGTRTWRGRTPSSLAIDDELSAAELRDFVTAVDERLTRAGG